MANVEHRAERSRDDRLADVIEGYLTASESGEVPSRTALLEQHPDLADDLAACFETLDFIGHSLGQAPATAVLECGQQFGEYQILREIGRGGMGVVYEAFHLGLERRVALKVLSGRSFEDERQRERFLLEAKTAAGLHHTNIVPIFEVGELDGVCYYAMQFIQGQSLGAILRSLRKRVRTSDPADTTIFPPGTIVRDERLVAIEPGANASEVQSESSAGELSTTTSEGGRPASVPNTPPQFAVVTSSRYRLAEGPNSDRYFREAARVIAQAADALAHAHGHDVVHRDVKPSNLILDAEGRIWVADFGLAFRSDDPSQSGSDAVGTPAYMSPEQVRTGSAPVDRRTDIYSLGATLYELLTLRPIFEGDTSLSVLTQIATVDPVPARRHNPRIPRDLDSIVRKATAKRTEDRYGDAAELAGDLRRYLNFEPIRARRVGPVDRLVLWCRREPRLALVTTFAALFIFMLTSFSHWVILRARNEAVKARKAAEFQLVLTKEAEQEAREHSREALFQQAKATRLSIETGRRWATLDLIKQAQDIRPDLALRDEAIAALSIADAHFYRRLPVESPVERLAFCPRERRIAFGCLDGSIHLWDFESDREPVLLVPPGQDTGVMAFSQCGRYLAAVESDGPVTVWDTVDRRLVTRLDVGEFRPRFLTFVAQQTCLIALNEAGTCQRWSIQREHVESLPSLELGGWHSATPGPDARSVTLLRDSGELDAYDVISGDRQAIDGIVPTRSRNNRIFWDASGKVLAATQRFGTLDLWRRGQSQPIRSLSGHRMSVRAVAFSPTAPLLATGGDRDSSLKLWDVATGEQIAKLRELQTGSNAASFSPDGRFLAAGGSDNTICLWEIETPKSLRLLAGHENGVRCVAVSPDGETVISGSSDGSVLLWPAAAGSEPVQLVAPRTETREQKFNPNSCAGLATSADGRLLAVRSLVNSVEVWNLATRERIATLDGDRSGGSAQFLPSSHEMIRAYGKSIQRWDFTAGSKPATLATASDPISTMIVSPDSRRVAVSIWRNRIEVFDLSSGDQLGRTLELPARAMSLAISPDNRLLAVADWTGSLRLYNLADLTPLTNWKESDDELTRVAFSPNGSWLALAGVDGLVRVRTVPDGKLVATLPGHEGAVRSLAFAPDGLRLVTGGDDKLVHVWELGSLNGELANLDLAW